MGAPGVVLRPLRPAPSLHARTRLHWEWGCKYSAGAGEEERAVKYSPAGRRLPWACIPSSRTKIIFPSRPGNGLGFPDLNCRSHPIRRSFHLSPETGKPRGFSREMWATLLLQLKLITLKTNLQPSSRIHCAVTGGPVSWLQVWLAFFRKGTIVFKNNYGHLHPSQKILGRAEGEKAPSVSPTASQAATTMSYWAI